MSDTPSSRRAPVQATRGMKPAGTISWEEHLLAHKEYTRRWGSDQSAERIAQRCGFDYAELVDFLGHAPETWEALASRTKKP